MQSFADLGVPENVVRALRNRGITAPFPVQRLVLGDVLEGRDVLVKAPTGSGKTLAFAIPLVQRTAPAAPTPAALVLAPTRELACQISEELETIARARSLRVCAVYGGVGISAQARRAAKAHILVATPGRLEDLLDRGAFSLDSVRLLVLDEADRMLDMGFRPAVDRIVAACPAKRQTLFFSATLDGLAGKIAERYTTDAVVHDHAPPRDPAAQKVDHRFIEVSADKRLGALLAELDRERDLALVFVRTKRGADRLAKRLQGAEIKALAIHGDKSQRQREQALQRFESGRIDTLVATDVAARGIDVDRVSHVINYDPPADQDTYVHRVGRTGRAGRSGVGITLVSQADAGDMRRIARNLGIGDGGAPKQRSARQASGEPGGGARGRSGRNRRRRRAPVAAGRA
ncbi:MAG TPA: DEAD/DEAH box helicase [Solirubrobacteraceae bacterium]|jgi:superfamily II DNA/RNA helicase|nr:DEAD/DEAH box helicase [Solirubrobacteraceae bacterium]